MGFFSKALDISFETPQNAQYLDNNIHMPTYNTCNFMSDTRVLAAILALMEFNSVNLVIYLPINVC